MTQGSEGGGRPTSFCAAVAGRHNAWRCAANAINRGGAGSGAVAISVRQNQRLVVVPGGATSLRARSGRLASGPDGPSDGWGRRES